MAAYSIVLNLSGNAVNQTERLADNLWRANSLAQKLAANLGAVGAAARSIPNNPLHVPVSRMRATNNSNAQEARYVAGMNRAASGMNRAATRMNTASNKQMRNHSRKGTSEFISRGFGMSMGGFSWRAGGITPLPIGSALTGLLKGINVAGIVTTIMASIAKTILKVIAGATIAPMLISGGVLAIGNSMLQSENMTKAIQLLSRRRQARLSLGAKESERANVYADSLSASYGFDRSAMLSGMTVLTGAGIGGDLNRRISMGQAAELSKIGGLISQQSGAPLEKVMTNIQQLLLQSTPNVRDIRELLNQAPILSTYALKDMEAKGINNVDVRTYLKDQSNMLSTMYRFADDLEPVGVARIKGTVDLAQQDMWAKWAENEAFFSVVGGTMVKLFDAFGTAISNLMTALANNPELSRWLEDLSMVIQHLGNNADWVVDKLNPWVEKVRDYFGIDVDEEERNRRAARREIFVAGAQTPEYRDKLRSAYLASPEGQNLQSLGLADDVLESRINRAVDEAINRRKFDDKYLQKYTMGITPQISSKASSPRSSFWDALDTRTLTDYTQRKENPIGLVETVTADSTKLIINLVQNALNDPENVRLIGMDKFGREALASRARFGSNFKGAYTKYFMGLLGNISNEEIDPSWYSSTQRIQSTNGGGGDGGNNGESLTGFNRDRRSLEIHFHAPIVEWNSKIEATNPQATVDAVAQDIEQIASAAIQKALIGASNKMSSRWY